MGCWDENLFKCSESHDQDGFHAHIWENPSKISFFGIKRQMTSKLSRIQHRVLKYCHICSNDNTGLTLTIFMALPI